MLALKKTLTIIALTASLLVVSPAAHAQAQGGFWSAIVSGWESVIEVFDDVKEWLRSKLTPSYDRPDSSGRTGVPELDPSAAGSAIVLLFGGVAYIASRRREDEVSE